MIYDAALEPLIPEQRRVESALAGRPPPPPELTLPTEDVQVPGGPHPLGVHILRPPGAIRAAMLHFHPGGFTFGTPAMSDGLNSELARAAGIAIVSVDYRLAPQHPHPAAVADAERAALWLGGAASGLFGTIPLLIGGESAGATLAVMLLLRLRAQRAAAAIFRGASLVAGTFDFSGTPSQRRATETHFLSPTRMRATIEAAFPGTDEAARRDPSISPLYADLAGLPPAIFSVGLNDAALDDSLFLAMRWRAAGNAAELHVYPESEHLLLSLPTAMAREARRRIGAFLARCATG